MFPVHRPRRRRRPFGPGALVVALGVAGLGAGCGETSTTTLSIATGSTSGLYYPLGGALASVWSRHIDGLNMKAETTAGSVTNLIQVAKGESEVGLSQGDALADALTGAGRFPERMPLQTLGKLYPNVVHLVTVRRAGIDEPQDLRGKRVSVGPPGSGNAVTAWNVLEALDLGEEDFAVRQLDYSQTSNGLKDGTLDAGFIAGGIGMPAVVEIAISRDMILVPFTEEEIERITTAEPAYAGFRVPPGVYQGVDEPVLTPTLWNQLVVHRDLDPGLAYDLTRTLFECRRELERISTVARFFDPATARDVGTVPVHPGARRFYEEVSADGSR
ncbi:MAG: TAXI family TRAP transporter solute-binding subunit [Gemmatimonadetes bacterium]|nr:TAXI family TRAP transporter solute-binding subunit [Gemmatimonadota bacterium]